MLLDIVILPPVKLRQYLGRAAQCAVRGYRTKYVIDNVKLVPHLSLFHINTTQGRLNKITNQIKHMLRVYRPVEVNLSRRQASERVVYYFLSKPLELKKLNRKIVECCAPLRTSIMPWPWKRRPTVLEIAIRRRYGVHLNIGRNFQPHFTVARLYSQSDASKVMARLPTAKFKFSADTIALCEVNKNHQVTKILKRFRV